MSFRTKILLGSVVPLLFLAGMGSVVYYGVSRLLGAAALVEHTLEALVVTDVVMPEMGGREFVARVKTVCPYAKVLYVSGYPFDSHAEEGSINPAAPFLRKPFNPTELTSMVRQELDAAASER